MIPYGESLEVLACALPLVGAVAFVAYDQWRQRREKERTKAAVYAWYCYGLSVSPDESLESIQKRIAREVARSGRGGV